MATLVKFRKDKVANSLYGPEITAIFPQLKYNKELYGNDRLTCYAHLGQHGCAHVDWINNCTEPAKESEYLPLLRELESIGYCLKICK